MKSENASNLNGVVQDHRNTCVRIRRVIDVVRVLFTEESSGREGLEEKRTAYLVGISLVEGVIRVPGSVIEDLTSPELGYALNNRPTLLFEPCPVLLRSVVLVLGEGDVVVEVKLVVLTWSYTRAVPIASTCPRIHAARSIVEFRVLLRRSELSGSEIGDGFCTLGMESQ